MNVLYHFILIDVDSSQSFTIPNNGKSFIYGWYSTAPPGGVLKEIGLQLKQPFEISINIFDRFDLKLWFQYMTLPLIHSSSL